MKVFSDDDYERDRIREINRQAEERFAVRIIGWALVVLLLLSAGGIYFASGH